MHVDLIIGHRKSVKAVPVYTNQVGRGWYAPATDTGENGAALVVYAEANPDDSVRVFVVLGNTLFFTWRVSVGRTRVEDEYTGYVRCVTGNRESAIKAARNIADEVILRNRLTERPTDVRAIRQTQQALALEAVAV